jgi:hypothetical protein
VPPVRDGTCSIGLLAGHLDLPILTWSGGSPHHRHFAAASAQASSRSFRSFSRRAASRTSRPDGVSREPSRAGLLSSAPSGRSASGRLPESAQPTSTNHRPAANLGEVGTVYQLCTPGRQRAVRGAGDVSGKRERGEGAMKDTALKRGPNTRKRGRCDRIPAPCYVIFGLNEAVSCLKGARVSHCGRESGPNLLKRSLNRLKGGLNCLKKWRSEVVFARKINAGQGIGL